MDMKLEVVILPVSDVDRTKDFYKRLGFREDIDLVGADGFRVVQLTPPGSPCSIIFGKGVTSAPPGSVDRLVLVVHDIEAARDELRSRGIEVGVFHDAGGGLGGGFIAGTESHAPRPDPQRRSYASYASFSDPDGTVWLLQEITDRLPGRVDVAAIAQLLHETSEHHGAFEAVAPRHDWWDWYAAYMEARERGSTPEEASASAGRYMADIKHVVVSRA